MKSLMILFGVLLMLMATPFVFDGILNAQTDEVTQNLSGITTSGNYTGNVTLGQPIYQNSFGSIRAITSNQTLDTPTAYIYNSVSRILTVSGLAESGLTRTLAVNFYITNADLPDYAAGFIGLLRWLWILIMLGLTGGAIYVSTQT